MSTYKTVAAWNVQRGAKFLDIVRMLRENSVDIALLQECDIGMARSGNVHVPREVAEGLGYEYTVAIEFEEHGIGNKEEREQFPRATNKNGLHCNATLSYKLPFVSHHIELSSGREWKMNGDQPRHGGRIALAVKIDGVYFVNVHLESRTSPEKRVGQMNRLLHALDRLSAERVVIGGDLNTKEEDDKLLFLCAENRGYLWRDANLDVGRFAGKRFDWFLYRGVSIGNPFTINATGISDHDLILVDVLA